MKNDIKKNGSGYYDPTAFEAIINAGGVNNMEVYKGDIFYIEKGKTGEKSPAVVVSATEVIEETGCAQVAWLTNKEENSSSTHVKVMCMIPSVAICEKLSFAYLDRFGEYIRTCTEKEIQDIDNAMLATLGIERQNDNADCEEIRTLKKELEEKQREIEEMKTSAREKETEEKEPDDQMEEAANRLQHEASVKCSRELEKAQKYKEGYTQGVEDLLRCIRRGE
jgi:mRNA interferase MazF